MYFFRPLLNMAATMVSRTHLTAALHSAVLILTRTLKIFLIACPGRDMTFLTSSQIPHLTQQ